jgi:hypothetical protein
MTAWVGTDRGRNDCGGPVPLEVAPWHSKTNSRSTGRSSVSCWLDEESMS